MKALLRLISIVVLMTVLTTACSSTEGTSPTAPSPVTPPPSPPASTSFDLETELIFCVAETNRHRATQGRAPLTRSSALEAYAAVGAREDGLTGQPAHQHFRSTNGGASPGRKMNYGDQIWQCVRCWGKGSPTCGPRAPAAAITRTCAGRTRSSGAACSSTA